MDTKILIIDDDTELSDMLVEYLKRFGFRGHSAAHASEGLIQLRRYQPNLIVLDIMLPGKSGFELCREIRRTSDIPILFLSARGEVSDRIVGLEFGADDYLSKPFEPRELVARIQTILRRSQRRVSTGELVAEKQKPLCIGNIEIDPASRSVRVNSREISLTTFEFELLLLFMSQSGTIVSRETISEKLKGINWDGMDRGIDIGVSRLRQKLGDNPKNPHYLKTIWGSGYLFAHEDAVRD